MTYAQFLAAFLVVPIAFLVALLRKHLCRRHFLACALVCLIAFVYTTPWDNYAARVGLWSFDPTFAPPSHFIFFLPWEEYAFYLLQAILTCLLTLALARRLRPTDGGKL